jgi:hypothetical protein
VPFTRATTATRTNAAGLIELTPYNLLQYSEMFSNAAWTKNNSSIAANIITAPNGTLTADKLVEDTSNAVHNVLFSLTPTITTYSISFYAKKAERNFAAFYFGGASWGGQGFIVNLTTGEVTTNTTGATPIITLLPDGWVKIEASRAATTAIQIQFQVFTALNASTISYTGDGASGIYIWGAQLVEGTDALPYQLTETRLNRPRVDFSLGGCPNLLLEPQRTNLALWSEQFDNAWWGKATISVTANTTTSPSGLLNADTLDEGTTTAIHRLAGTACTITAGSTNSFSLYVKNNNMRYLRLVINDVSDAARWIAAQFDLDTQTFTTGLGTTPGSVVASASIQSVGNGWFRVNIVGSLLITTSALPIVFASNGTAISSLDSRGGNAYTGTNRTAFIWGAQFELGAYPTSYIPTSSASVTRNADSFALSNVFTNNMISSAGGTWFVDLKNNIPYTRDSSANGLYLTDATAISFGFRIKSSASPLRYFVAKVVGGIETSLYLTSANASKIAIKWNGSTADVFENGVKVVSATAFTDTAMQVIATNVSTPVYLNDTALYNTPISDAECIAITS